ncbi:hypothetical protein BKA63DRAFT_269269 [Paraphoma chrysanthemicola]|nr:hypothetical protein BKA63DRAFT_269269 [Paraphoma chrysanthemicola]
MAIDLGIIGLVGSAIKLSWSVYDKGFTKDKSSPQRYIEFGDALHGLHSNLNTIETVVTTANSSLASDSVGSFGASAYDVSSLTEIIGNFRLTLEECRDFLNDETKFRQKDGFVTNILYNINVDPQVVQLTERLAFHSTKIALILDTFHIHLHSQLRDLHKEQHQDTAEVLQELKHLLISGRENSSEVVPLQIERDVIVPPELSEKFAEELRKRAKTVTDDAGVDTSQLSVQDGVEAFLIHFKEASDSMSYLRLMKSIWIMDRVRESDGWHRVQRTNPGGLYDRCVREMDRRLRTECSRVAASRLPRPQLSMVLQLPEEAFLIWPKLRNSASPSSPAHLGVLLDIPVYPDVKSHTLRIVRNIDGTLGFEDTMVNTSRSSGVFSHDRVVQRLNIDLRKAHLVPIYAMPSMTSGTQPSLTMKVQSSRDGINGVAPEFKTKSDLLKLQHLITGYRCVKQRSHIKIKSLTCGQDYPHIATKARTWSRRPSSSMIEIGNLQLWQKAAYEKCQNRTAGDGDRDSRTSGASSPYPSSSHISIGASSIMSSMSAAHTQQISLGSAHTAIELTQPEPPLLVLFLKHPDAGQLSFLVIELDERTRIEPNSCDCRSTKRTCSVSVLERSGTPLLARRYYARNGLNSWNLAAIGEHWSRTESEAVHVRDMFWLRISFLNEDERRKFNDNVADLVRMFTARMDDYRKDLKAVRGTHIITQAA